VQHNPNPEHTRSVMQLRVLQCVAVRCRALQCVAVCCSTLPSVYFHIAQFSNETTSEKKSFEGKKIHRESA